MRDLNINEARLIREVANKLPDTERRILLDDLCNARVCLSEEEAGRVLFSIDGYVRPPYLGQHAYPVEMVGKNNLGQSFSIILYADCNGRLYELEVIDWEGGVLDWGAISYY
ncbi:hypothetical protein [Solilutibacter pythonis]|uniref:hypothetical protein n=1 Tax=Solilutibacter pythonis TaxID=2483112 RepID=UPI0011C3EA89|nr:hypothetical protein [Lysobacter pythonis]